ncbi:MAG: phosphoesterase RecJ domain-containing protein [Clostridia bacterium]|nr:phosphoesterase RecJ domain-containing protein [Clostridia bacterium]
MQQTLNEAAAFLRAHDHYLILTHKRPDGDTIGSGAALCRVLRAAGKTAFLLHNEEITPRFAPLCEGLTLSHSDAATREHTVIATDIAAETLLPASALPYEKDVALCVDHHPSNTGYAARVFVRGAAAATGELVYDLAHALGVTPDTATLDALYVSVATDTGCFRFSNTTALAHRIAAEAIEGGVDFHRHNRECFELKSRARFAVERKLFDEVAFAQDGQIASAVLERGYIESVGATPDDLDNLSTLLVHLEGVRCAALLQETNVPGEFKASVRTHKPIDASAICAELGGGGHARAAGCTLVGTAESCRERLVAAAAAHLTC